MHHPSLLIAFAALTILSSPLTISAAEFTVKMVNKDTTGRVLQFEPAFIKIAPGDVVHFLAMDKGHDTESLVVPEGADNWKGALSQNLDVTFSVAGLYAYKCAPHVGLGMVGLIEVGDAPENVDAIKALALPGKATARMSEVLAEAGL